VGGAFGGMARRKTRAVRRDMMGSVGR
jgi:hypothetical protein